MRFHKLRLDLSLPATRRDLIGLGQLNKLPCRSLRVLYSISVSCMRFALILQGHSDRSDLYERQHSSFFAPSHPEFPVYGSSPTQNHHQ
jgi:hypothetical protein